MFAFPAAEEPHFALICGTKLAQPPFGGIVSAFRAPDVDCRQGRYLLRVIDDGNLLLLTLRYFFHAFVPGNIPGITAFPANKFTAG